MKGQSPTTTIVYKEFGRRLKAERTKRHLTQEALAKRVSLTRTSITNIEKGRQKILLDTFLAIAGCLDVSPESLLPSSTKTERFDDALKARPTGEQAWIRLILANSRK